MSDLHTATLLILFMLPDRMKRLERRGEKMNGSDRLLAVNKTAGISGMGYA